jgi:hypothetical protein
MKNGTRESKEEITLLENVIGGPKMSNPICRISHHSHIGPDHTHQKIKHIGCRVTVKKDKIDFMGDFGISEIGHACSCDGFKPNTSLKRAIKKYQKYLKGLPKDDLYEIKEIKSVIRRFKKDIKENPKNLLHWQLEELKL